MKACDNHDHTVVVYDELANPKGCPFCDLDKAFHLLVEQFDELEGKLKTRDELLFAYESVRAPRKEKGK